MSFNQKHITSEVNYYSGKKYNICNIYCLKGKGKEWLNVKNLSSTMSIFPFFDTLKKMGFPMTVQLF